MRWVDSHCHLQDEPDAGAVIERARAAGVTAMVCVGTDLASSRRAVELAAAHDEVWAAVGLHPHDASRLGEEWDDLAALVTEPRVVAVGETGFDLHYRHSEPEDQEAAFRAHIGLAHEAGKALVIHSRDAWAGTFRVLEKEGVPPRTVFHCFTGGPAEAERAVALGAHVSFSGIVTFRDADDVRAAATLVPLDRLLVETDSPYLAPHPHRGRRNEPAYVVDVGRGLAAAIGRDEGDVAAATVRNAASVFGPSDTRRHAD